jgi:hypothetical protein
MNNDRVLGEVLGSGLGDKRDRDRVHMVAELNHTLGTGLRSVFRYWPAASEIE